MNAAVFDPALAGRPARLVGDDGRILPVAAQRWLAPAHGEDDWLLDRCTGPTVDLGCGPGRLVAELAGRGVPALGVDCSHSAVRQCHSRGAPLLRRDVFAPVAPCWSRPSTPDTGCGGGPPGSRKPAPPRDPGFPGRLPECRRSPGSRGR